MLPFAGITQIRFKGVSHPDSTDFRASRTPSVAPLEAASGELYACRR
jgi:hypothetical protein